MPLPNAISIPGCFHSNANCFTVIGKRDGLFYSKRHCLDCNTIIATMDNILAPETYLEDMKRLFPDYKFISEEEYLTSQYFNIFLI